MDGILNIDKPAGVTSHAVVQVIRKRFDAAKAGHLGTLDPLATGVLPVAMGKATRFSQFLPNFPKEYEGELRFGFATNTYDCDGVPTTDERPLEGNVEEAVHGFIGVMDQVPPPFSAKKIGGIPAYRLARKNRAANMTAVRVEIRQLEILSMDLPLLKFRVVCSPGTYVRSLVHDLGQRLGCGAHLTALRRTGSGEFRIENAVRLDNATVADVVPVDDLLRSMPRIEVSGSDETKVIHGNQIRAEGTAPLARIFNKKGEFIAVASVENGWVRPRLVLTSITSR